MRTEGGVGRIAISTMLETSAPHFFLCVYGNFRRKKNEPEKAKR
jgi:hypothetical protein